MGTVFCVFAGRGQGGTGQVKGTGLQYKQNHVVVRYEANVFSMPSVVVVNNDRSDGVHSVMVID